MDIDPNFHESESLFYNALDHLKQEEGDSEEEEKKAEPKETKEEGKEAVEDKKKPVKFLQRPKEVLQAYAAYNDDLSEEDDEDKLLDSLQEQMGLTKKEEETAKTEVTDETKKPEDVKTEETKGEEAKVPDVLNNESNKEEWEKTANEALDDLLDDLL